MQIFCLGRGNFLQEYAYFMGHWSHGHLHDLRIILEPTSSLAAIRCEDEDIYIHYQGRWHHM